MNYFTLNPTLAMEAVGLVIFVTVFICVVVWWETKYGEPYKSRMKM